MFIYSNYSHMNYTKINGFWYKSKCDDCGALVKKHNAKRCRDCWQENIKGTVRVVHNVPHSEEAKRKMSIAQYKNGSGIYWRLAKIIKKCERCGLTDRDKKLNVHHIDRNRKNNVITNLEVLCTMCHAYEHKNWLAANKAWRERVRV